MTKKERIQEAIECVGAEAVNLAITLVEVSDPDGAYTHLQDMGEFEAAEAVEIIYFGI
jgi:hypothetical protein